jgi:hypothetical protein
METQQSKVLGMMDERGINPITADSNVLFEMAERASREKWSADRTAQEIEKLAQALCEARDVGRLRLALLAKYATRQPRKLVQFDAFEGIDGSVDDPEVFQSGTYDLMRFPASVRVLVSDDAAAANVVPMLRHIADWIEQTGLAAEWQKPAAAAEHMELDAAYRRGELFGRGASSADDQPF